MKRYLALVVIICQLMSYNAFGASEWAVSDPAGTRNASDIDYYVTTNNTAVDRLLSNYRNNAVVTYVSASSISVSAGEVVCSNSDGSVRHFRQNTTSTTANWTNIDTGAEAVSTTYYVYAVADADANTFTVKISASATSPTGATYYKKIASFYNNSDGDISNDDTLINYNNYYALKLGDWTSKTGATVYQASTDGFVVGSSGVSSGDVWKVYTDASNPPTTQRVNLDSNNATQEMGGTVPVRKGDYWKTNNATDVVYWIPLEREV